MQRVIYSIKKLMSLMFQHHDYNLSYQLSEEDLKIITELSSFLPEFAHSRFQEIDDLLYSNENIPVKNVSSRYSNESKNVLIDRCFYRICTMDGHYTNLILDTVVLQMIENSSPEVFKKNVKHVLRLIFTLVYRETGINMCRAVKFLRVSLDKDRVCVLKMIRKTGMYKYDEMFRIYSMQNSIPEAKHPAVRRIRSWLMSQCSVIFRDIELKRLFRDNPNLKLNRSLAEKKHDADFIRTFIRYLDRFPYFENPVSSLVDHVFQYFSSAKNKKQVVMRAKKFFKGCKNPSASSSYGAICKMIVSSFNCHLFRIDKCPVDMLELIDKRHCNDIEPFISGCDEREDQQTSEDIKESQHQPDFTIELFTAYNQFLKCLYVLSKLHEAYLICERPDKVEDYEAIIFRNPIYRPMITLINRLIDPSQRGDFPWWFNTVLKKCPFLFVSKRHENMIGDLMRLLNGDDVDEVTSEKIYCFVNGLPRNNHTAYHTMKFRPIYCVIPSWWK